MQDSKDLGKPRLGQPQKPGWLPRPALDRFRVMVVEDSELDRMICVRALKKAVPQLSCDTFDSASAALMHLQGQGNRPPELIFLDVNIPEMNGFEFLEHVATDVPLASQISVLLMTSAPLPIHLRRRVARFRNCIGEVEKPLTAEIVRSTIDAIQRRHAQTYVMRPR